MARIKIMPESLANKIAAGEVVERPASVVKELLENAIDAGAHKINIEALGGGKTVIRLVDDGEGMTRDDAITAFERHATSKLHTADQLASISTLGFRGEALPSIASVSRLFLRTRTAGEAIGTEVEFSGGKLGAVREIAWPGGTEVEVKDLFFNVPVRRKFLKTDATESYHITSLVQHYALANPEVSFLFVRDGREVIRCTSSPSLRDRAYQLLGASLLEKLNPVDFEGNELRIHGLASNPQEQRSSRDAQYFFVNGRFVKDHLIARAVSEAYRSMIPAGTYPAAVLFLEIEPAEVDVNVHPAKTEVRFLHEGLVLAAVRDAIVSALHASHPVTRLPRPAYEPRPVPGLGPLGRTEHTSFTGLAAPKVQSAGASGPRQQPPAHDEPSAAQRAAPSTAPGAEYKLAPDDIRATELQRDLGLTFMDGGRTFSGAVDGVPSLPAADELPDLLAEHLKAQFDDYGAGGQGCGTGTGQSTRSGETLPGLAHGIKPLGQIRDSYIVATDEEGLLLIDQHVAHERILFEQYRDTRLNRPVEAQPMLVPQTADLTPAESEAFNVVQGELEQMGIEATQLSGRTLAVKSAPAGLQPGDAMAVVREVIAAAEQHTRSLDNLREEIAASLACKAAIKVNMPLTNEKMQWLIDELMKTGNPMTCPHGRPILMRFGLRDIERGFKRPV